MPQLDFTTHSPEQGWPPFLAWMEGEGLDPRKIKRLRVDTVTMVAGVWEFVEKVNGRRVIDPETGQAAVKPPYVRKLSSLPPLNRPDSEALGD